MVNSKVLMVSRGLVVIMVLGLAWWQASGQETAGEGEPSPGVREEALISINIKDADIRNVLRLIATSANVNIIAGPEVQASVSVRIKDVPWETALDSILKTYGFAYVRQKNIIRVTTVEKLKEEDLVTKTYFLNFATAATKKEKTADGEEKEIPGLEESIKAILSERGKIRTDERTNALIVTDVPSYLTEVEKIIKQLDTETVQVRIEALMVDAKVDSVAQLGIDWEYRDDRRYNDQSLKGHFDHDLTEVTKGGIFSLGTVADDDYKILLNILKTTSTDYNVLSNPKVTTLNNQMAKIDVTTTWPLPKYVLNETTGNYEITGWGDDTKFGITLEVTPTVNPAGYITMKIIPEVTEEAGTIGEGLNLRPKVDTQKIDTNIMIKDGQTVVIGGLLKDKVDKAGKKIPILGDIPLVGFLFRSTTDTMAKRDLLIFITGHIIKIGELAEKDRLKLEKWEHSEKLTEAEDRKKAVDSHYLIGKMYYQERRYNEAIQRFRKILELDPTHRGARKYLKRAERYLEKKK